VKAKSIVAAGALVILLCAPMLAAGVENTQPSNALEQADRLLARTEGEKAEQAPASDAAAQQPPAPASGGQETRPPAAPAEQFKFEMSEIEKKPYRFGGFAEVRPVLDWLNKDSALYKAKYYNRDEPDIAGEFNSRVLMDGTLEKGIASFFARANFDANDTIDGWSTKITLYEADLTLRPSDSWIFDVGRKTFKWGKGYAYNPAAFIDRPKDPSDPDLALKGFWAVSGLYLKSFQGPLKTFSFQTVFLPVIYDVYDSESINDDFAGSQGNASGAGAPSTSNQVNVAARAYFLLYDTDIDLTFLTGQTKTTRYGMDFSRNITTNLEVHGEFSWINDFKKQYVDANGVLHSSTFDAFSSLLGLRYLSEASTTYILEWYHNGAGLTKGQMQDFFSFVNTGYDTYISTGNATQIEKASNLVSGSYGKNSPMQDYLYLRISQDEPFDILYWTPAITSIVNLQDWSMQIIPEVTCTRITNWEFRFRTYMLLGGSDTEFGNKQNDYRLELRVRRFF
jgi:hypothetical protein